MEINRLDQGRFERRLAYWQSQPAGEDGKLAGNINAFEGPFNIQDVTRIHYELREFLNEVFHKEGRLRRVELDEINQALNNIWEGPGSMPKVVTAIWEMRQQRFADMDYQVKDVLAGIEVPTIDSDEPETEDDFISEDE